MIKTKLFTGYFTGSGSTRTFIDVDTELNEFLEKEKVLLIDVKLSTCVDGDGESWNTALLIYKEVAR